MIPILYSNNYDISNGNVPEHYGLGTLVDCLSGRVKESRNGIYELEMEYAANGQYADKIAPGNFIKVKPNFTDDPQLFHIYNVGKSINGRFTVNAEHISYLISDYVITSGSANNIVTATQLLSNAAGRFTINTTKNTQGDFKITEPSSVRSWFGGKEGSLLDVYGGGEWHYDNFTATLMQNRGEDRGVQIRYGKNLLDLSQENDNSNLVAGVIPYYKDDEGNVTTGARVSTGTYATRKTIAIDFSQDVDIDSDTSIEDQLQTLAEDYISNHNLTTILSSIKLDFIQLKELEERVDLCDTVHIFYEPLGITATAKCISTTWDVLEERYIETEFGDPRTSIVDSFQDAAATAEKNAEAIKEAQILAGNKAKVFTDIPVPPYDVGDIWVNGSDIYYCIVPKTKTVTGEAESAVVSGGYQIEFNTPLAEPLLKCICYLWAGCTSITITVADENDVQETYLIEFDEPLHHDAIYNVLEGVLTFSNNTTEEVDPVIIYTLSGYNLLRATYHASSGNTGTVRMEIEYLIEGFQMSDWNMASNYVSQSRLEDAIADVTANITGNSGGYVILHDSDGDKKPDEILIMDAENIKDALKIWRWNQGGLGFSSTGYNGPFNPAIDSEGRIVANMISTGNLDALKVTIEHLTATMFEGGKISLGGLNNQSGVLEIKDESGMVIGEMTKLGLKFYGAGPVGQRPYVVLNNTDGFKGYDANGNAIFWVNRDEFRMKKCVAENEINACGMIKMLPMTIENNGTVVNRGIAFVAIV